MQRVKITAINWGQQELQAFQTCKHALIHRVTLSYHDDSKSLNFYVDASNLHWAGIVTQVPTDDLFLNDDEKRHEPLGFFSGSFIDTQRRWSTFEKEAFCVMAPIECIRWLASISDCFNLFTYHNNLVFPFDPLSLVPDLSQAALRKVIRWAVRLSGYNYVCLHISGANNVWADL